MGAGPDAAGSGYGDLLRLDHLVANCQAAYSPLEVLIVGHHATLMEDPDVMPPDI